MISFCIKRYMLALSVNRRWLIAALIPVLIYIVWAAVRPDHFVICRDAALTRSAPVALPEPVGYTTMNELIKQSADFFTDRFAVAELYRQINGLFPGEKDNQQYAILMDTIAKSMELSMPDEGHARISYRGRDSITGEKLVSFFASRLADKAQNGIKRLKTEQKKSQQPGTAQPPAYEPDKLQIEPASAVLSGAIQVVPQHVLWKMGRSLPAILILLISLVLILTLIGVKEWSDLSFKSERQVARYLGVPVLGAMPNLNFICDSLSIKDAG